LDAGWVEQGVIYSKTGRKISKEKEKEKKDKRSEKKTKRQTISSRNTRKRRPFKGKERPRRPLSVRGERVGR
jgi:hypothetical protein